MASSYLIILFTEPTPGIVHALSARIATVFKGETETTGKLKTASRRKWLVVQRTVER